MWPRPITDEEKALALAMELGGGPVIDDVSMAVAPAVTTDTPTRRIIGQRVEAIPPRARVAPPIDTPVVVGPAPDPSLEPLPFPEAATPAPPMVSAAADLPSPTPYVRPSGLPSDLDDSAIAKAYEFAKNAARDSGWAKIGRRAQATLNKERADYSDIDADVRNAQLGIAEIKDRRVALAQEQDRARQLALEDPNSPESLEAYDLVAQFVPGFDQHARRGAVSGAWIQKAFPLIKEKMEQDRIARALDDKAKLTEEDKVRDEAARKQLIPIAAAMAKKAGYDITQEQMSDMGLDELKLIVGGAQKSQGLGIQVFNARSQHEAREDTGHRGWAALGLQQQRIDNDVEKAQREAQKNAEEGTVNWQGTKFKAPMGTSDTIVKGVGEKLATAGVILEALPEHKADLRAVINAPSKAVRSREFARLRSRAALLAATMNQALGQGAMSEAEIYERWKNAPDASQRKTVVMDWIVEKLTGDGEGLTTLLDAVNVTEHYFNTTAREQIRAFNFQPQGESTDAFAKAEPDTVIVIRKSDGKAKKMLRSDAQAAGILGNDKYEVR